MEKTISEIQIGSYTVARDENGALHIQGAELPNPITFAADQVQTLQQWLQGNQQPASTVQDTPPAETITASADPAETVQQIIDEMILTARTQYPASLAPENRDRFIDQIARDARVKPLMSQGKVSMKQILLWVDQRLNTRKQAEEEPERPRKRWSLFG